ncbi:MAG TPA: Crp/Fnr family transcriptional regulator [Pyrinomonadaceae bacterium]|nr:Crp/Fnr family transcriptional regulator [Pyrinomonadaceae bacterium]
MDALGGVDSHLYPAGVELFRQDSCPGQIYFVETGVTKLTRYEENGGEFILDIRFPGSLLGSEAVIRQKPHSFSAATATACRLMPLTASRFLSLLRTESLLASFLQDSLCAAVLSQAARMSEIACLPARQRLEQLLWMLAEQSCDGGKAEVKFQLPLRHWEAAQLLAITPTYLSRLLGELETEEIISRRSGWIVLREPASLWHRVDD